jgi:hypothetical protein
LPARLAALWPPDLGLWYAPCFQKRMTLKAPLRDDDRIADAEPTFASDAEIALAQRLRRRLEERFLALAADRSAPNPYGNEPEVEMRSSIRRSRRGRPLR